MRRSLLVAVLCALFVPLAAVAGEDQDPIVTVPADMIVEAQNFTGASVSYTASATDYRGRPIPVSCTPASGTLFGFGTTTVICTARDSGETTTKRFHVTVADRTPPTITVPSKKRVSTRKRKGAVVKYAASASDIVDGAVAVSCSPASGALFRAGTTRVNCSARDARGNSALAPFDVTVVFTRARNALSAAMLAPRPGARVTTPPLLRWRPARKVVFYNVQVFRRGQKILSAWPTRPRFRLHRRWRYNGHRFRLRPGRYTWLVWPAHGPLEHPRFGRVLGLSSFVVAGR